MAVQIQAVLEDWAKKVQEFHPTLPSVIVSGADMQVLFEAIRESRAALAVLWNDHHIVRSIYGGNPEITEDERHDARMLAQECFMARWPEFKGGMR